MARNTKKQKTNDPSSSFTGSMKLMTYQWKLDSIEEVSTKPILSNPPTAIPHDTKKLEECLWTWSWMDDEKRKKEKSKTSKISQNGHSVFSIADPSIPRDYSKKRTRTETAMSPPRFKSTQETKEVKMPSSSIFRPENARSYFMLSTVERTRESVDNVMISKLTSNFLHFADTYVRS
jgi:hypothetical protein